MIEICTALPGYLTLLKILIFDIANALIFIFPFDFSKLHHSQFRLAQSKSLILETNANIDIFI